MKIYNPETSASILNELKDWTYGDNSILKKIVFKNFSEAVSFIVQLGFIAEKLNHHPEIHNVYNIVQLKLTTHDFNGVTEKDFELAKAIDNLLKK
mgnify:CR=1 FL=1